MSNVLIIDVGTQSMRGIIFDEKGNMLAKEQIKYPPYISKKEGYVEQRAEMYWETLCQITQKLAANSAQLFSSLVAMSVDTFRDTAVLLDKDCNVVRDCILWSDQRLADTSDKLPLLQRFAFKLVGMDRAIRAIRKKVKTRWIQQNEPELWQKVHKVVHVSGYINYKLTGNLIDCYASSIGHLPFDNKHKKWMTKRSLLYPVFDLPISMMIPLCNPGDVMGEISAETAQLTALPIGLKVYASGSDTSCETLGAGCIERNAASISFGTAASVQLCSKKYFEPEAFMPAYASVLKDYHNPEVQIFRGYWMVSWFKQNFAIHLEQRAEAEGVSVEDILNEEMAKIPAGADGLVLQPFWQAGLTTPEARGAIIGFRDYHTHAHVYRAIIEGIDFALREGLERMERRGKHKVEFVTVAGGGSQSDVICQIAADILNKPVKRVQTYETSALGAAMSTFIAIGLYKNETEARNAMVRYTDTFTPNCENVKTYNHIYNKVYLKLYKQLQKLYLQLEE